MPGRRWGSFGAWGTYVPAAERRTRSARKLEALRMKGKPMSPVRASGRKRAIAHTFWGRAWCENLESYSDFANRLPRGRTYVRNGSVWDLRIAAGKVSALVMGRQPSPYRIEIGIHAVSAARWREVAARSAGRIASLVELLEGKLAHGVMEVMVDRASGLFPSPAEIRLSCSCPDWASMCKHVAAALYGVGVRLDESPELLFVLRGVDPLDLVAAASAGPAPGEAAGPGMGSALEGDLAEIFGIDLESRTEHAPRAAPDAPERKRPRASAVGRPAPRVAMPASREITLEELLARGVPRSTFQNWPAAGVLEPTGRRGVYRTTPTTEERIARVLARSGRNAAAPPPSSAANLDRGARFPRQGGGRRSAPSARAGRRRR